MSISHKCSLSLSFAEQSGMCISNPSYVYYGAGILTTLRAERGIVVRFPWGTRHRFQGIPSTPMQLAAGSFTLRVKRPTPEAHHSPLSSDEISNEWSYTSAGSYNFMAWRGRPLPLWI